jgi:hypothetical protein
MPSRTLCNPLAVFTVDRGYLCRVDDRGMLNYDYPEDVELKVKHPNVYQQLLELKKEHKLMHTITPAFPTFEMLPHDKIKWHRAMFQNLTPELVTKIKLFCRENFADSHPAMNGDDKTWLVVEFSTLEAEVIMGYWERLEQLMEEIHIELSL